MYPDNYVVAQQNDAPLYKKDELLIIAAEEREIHDYLVEVQYAEFIDLDELYQD